MRLLLGGVYLEPGRWLLGLLILRRSKRSKEERESSAARRDADKGERTASEGMSETPRQESRRSTKTQKRGMAINDSKSGDDEARANSRNDANVASGT